MDLSDLVSPDAVIPTLKVQSKKQAIQALAEKAASLTGVPEREIFDTLLQRERLGSTGVGHGIAIPHGKLVTFDGIIGVFARLETPIEFESLDGEPVDLIFLLLASEGAGADHLKALARIARVFRNSHITTKLRETRDADSLYAVLTEDMASNAA
ncbi:MAG: PTS IIA-like nitrogen regulatory protein PtsN [Hyphomicrobiales bacterium]